MEQTQTQPPPAPQKEKPQGGMVLADMRSSLVPKDYTEAKARP